MLDVRWAKGNSYCYEVHELTKGGSLHKGRYRHPLYPSSRVSIERCDEPLPEETRRQAEGLRRSKAERLADVLEKDDLAMFERKPPPTPPQRTYLFWAR